MHRCYISFELNYRSLLPAYTNNQWGHFSQEGQTVEWNLAGLHITDKQPSDSTVSFSQYSLTMSCAMRLQNTV